MTDLASLIIRQVNLPGVSGAIPLPPEPVVPEDQAKFENALNPGAGSPNPPEAAAQGAPEPSSVLPSQPVGLSGDSILNTLARMSGPAPAAPPQVTPLDSPEKLIAFQSSLVRGTTTLDLVGEIRSRAEDGIDQLTRG
jgi:hypothetical protein